MNYYNFRFIIGPNGVVSSRLYTGHNPVVPATFNVQLLQRINTIFPYVGFLFEYFCALFSILVMIASCMPKERAEKIVSVLNFSDYIEFPTDDENEREIVKSISMSRLHATSSSQASTPRGGSQDDWIF